MDAAKFSYKRLVQTLEEAMPGPLSDRAKEMLRVAMAGHRGQYRSSRIRQQRIPFIVHPVGTARLAITYHPLVQDVVEDLDTVVCVSLAHDLLEDTRVDGSEIEATAGSRVRGYAEALTKPPAEVAGRSSGDRNAEFVNRIASAGPTAVFVKMCDSMHNMSRPASTPANLLRKAVRKAKNQYQPLLSRCPLPARFAKVYDNAIAEGEAATTAEADRKVESRPIDSLEAAIATCNAASRGKVLELHDITAIVTAVCQASESSIWRCRGRNVPFLTPLVATQGSQEERIAVDAYLDEPLVLNGKAIQQFFPGFGEPGCPVAYTVPIQLGPEVVLVIAIAYESERVPAWLSLDAATMLVEGLAHRLVVSEADRRSRLAGEAARLGMQLDTDLAVQVGVEAAELKGLTQWIDCCRQATSMVEGLIRLQLQQDDIDVLVRRLTQVESRAKSINSILGKYLSSTNRVWPEYQLLEDIAGVRVICPSQSSVGVIEEILMSSQAAASGIRSHPTIDTPRRDYVTTPTTRGYRAIHLILEVETRFAPEGIRAVPCEVQLRTILQDTWAKISHATVYRARGKKDHQVLQQMGQALESCEQLTEKLVARYQTP